MAEGDSYAAVRIAERLMEGEDLDPEWVARAMGRCRMWAEAYAVVRPSVRNAAWLKDPETNRRISGLCDDAARTLGHAIVQAALS